MNKVTVTIHGREYLLSGDLPAEDIQSIAKQVDAAMDEIAAKSPMSSRADLAVLAALHIVEKIVEKENNAKQSESDRIKAESEEAQIRIKEYEEKLKELQNKVSEYENNFFDLQMENVRLKDELEKLKQV